MDERSSRFRVYRVVESVPHVNFFDTEATRLYTVYQSGYGDFQPAVDDLRTGDLVEATLAGDADDSEEAWSITALERVGGVTMEFAVDAAPPAVAADLWEPGRQRPVNTVLEQDGEPVGAAYVQPREPLPGGSFVPSVLTGLLPMEHLLTDLPEVGAAPAHALFVDPDPPDVERYTEPYGVALFFTEAGRDLLADYRERYGIDPDGDSRPDYDPYGL